MPHRDPRTGQFVSGSSEEESITAGLGMNIPAADLSGGNNAQYVDGEEATLVDFTEVLDSDEVFEIHSLMLANAYYAPTTATAEGSALVEWELTPDPNGSSGAYAGTAFWNSSPDREEGIADMFMSQTDGEETLSVGVMGVIPSLNDTTNGTGAGGDWENERVNLGWEDPIEMDANDALYLNQHHHFDNISDHAVSMQSRAVLKGRTVEF